MGTETLHKRVTVDKETYDFILLFVIKICKLKLTSNVQYSNAISNYKIKKKLQTSLK
jgi:hypothetical protein